MGTVVALALVCAFIPASAAAAHPDTDAPRKPRLAVPGELIVQYEVDASAGERAATRREAGVRTVEGLRIPDTQLVATPSGSTNAAIAELRGDPGVAAVSPNWLRRPAAVPDDPFFDELWGLHNTGQPVGQTNPSTGTPDADIDAPGAWNIQPGWGPGSEEGVVVVVMDTGVDLSHSELSGRLWTNPGEIAENGIDDDLNGYVDDVHGYDFAGEDVDDPLDGDSDPDDPDGHGTHVAGTVLAEGNNGEGVIGVAGGSLLMALKVCAIDEEGEASCPLADILKAYAYAIDNGARVLNGSLGGPGFSPAEVALLNSSPGVLFVFAAGNGGDDGIGDDNDSAPEYPCALDEEAGYSAENLLCVAATNQSDGLASFSNFGAASVDIGAPGTRVLSTYPETLTPSEFLPYAYLSGTSMATPHVSGVAALLFAALPSTTTEAARNAILESAEPRAALAGKTVTGGRLNARLTLEELGLEPSPSSEDPEEPEGESEEQGGIIAANTAASPAAIAGHALNDRAAPNTVLRQRPARLLRTQGRAAKAVFRFRSNERGVTFLCQFDRKRYRRCPARFVRRFGIGRHVLRVKARDAAGNVDRTPARYRFRVKRVRRSR